MVGVHPMGLDFESKFHVGNYPQVWRGSPLGRVLTSKYHTMDVSKMVFFVLPLVHLTGSITFMLVPIRKALLSLNIQS